MAVTVDPSKYIKGLTSQKLGGWVVLRHAWHDSGKIYVSGDLGGENSGGINGNGYSLNHTDVDFAVYERIAGSSGSGIKRNVVPIKIAGTGNASGNTPVVLIFGVDQKIQQTDGQHEYNIEASGKDSHGSSHRCDIKWIPSPAPPSGPIVVLENKSGHFLSSGDVKLHVNIFTNPCSGDNANATHIMTSVDGGAWANSNTFPHIETISGIGLHTFKVKGCANTLVGQEISYSFSIGDNDWSNTHMTPVKTIRHIGKKGSFINFYSHNAIPTPPEPSKGFVNFDDIFGGGNCYYSNTRILNANTQEIVGEGSSAYSYTRTGSAIAGSAQSIGGWENFEIYPDKVVGKLALGYAEWMPDSIWMNILDTTDNTSYGHSFATPNSPWFSTSNRTGYSGAADVEIPYVFKEGHSYEMQMYGSNGQGGIWPLHSAGPGHSGKYVISNLSMNTFKLEPRSLFQQTDSSNTFIETYFGGEPDTNTFVKFSDVCVLPKADAMDYFRSTRTPDHEVHLLAISYDQLTIWDECSTPLPTIQEQGMASSPNSDGKYEFTRSGIWANMRVGPMIHPIPDQFYKLTTSNTLVTPITSSAPSYGYLTSDTTKSVLINPNRGETQLRIDIFNSCGGTITQTFDLLYIGSTGGTGTIGQGQGPSGSTIAVTTTSTSGSKPGYHRLIVNSLNE